MTLLARDGCVSSQQWILRPGMVEVSFKGYAFPGRGRMAGFAGLWERSLVRIGMARRALVKLQANIVEVLRISAEWRVALLAIQSCVCPCERIFGSGMVKLLC